MPTENNLSPKEVYETISGNIGKVMRGQSTAMRKLLSAFASGGHVLLEDYPGTGKTTLAKALSLSINSQFKRIQFTPDLLPSDILGVSIYDQKENRFNFHKGPVFTNILLADEINRASPRTQSALLEAMAESHVSLDGKMYHLEKLFFCYCHPEPCRIQRNVPPSRGTDGPFCAPIRSRVCFFRPGSGGSIRPGKRSSH